MDIMYKKYFGFKSLPFSIAPDPRYLYMSERHREALAHLLFGIKTEGGFVLLTGEVGTGKTTICRCLLEQAPQETVIAFILNPKLTVQELLATICEEFGFKYPKGNTSNKVFVDYINKFLLYAHAKGRKPVLIIDEAQNLSVEVLEQLRLLTNLETNERKLLQIILLGQPELKNMLSQPELRQLAQRITARYHLGPLSKKEVGSYVSYRMSIAGASRQSFRHLFPAGTINRLFHFSDGIPRLINIICDRALLGAYAQEKDRIDKKTLTKAAREILGKAKEQQIRSAKTTGWVMAGVALLVGGAALAYAYYMHMPAPDIIDPPAIAALQENRSVDVERESTIEPEPVSDSGTAITLPRLTSLQWPANQPIVKSEETAYQALFKSWGISYDPETDGPACLFAESKELRCLHLQSSLTSLLHLNRPAILRLHNDQGEDFYATLVAFQKETATFVMGGETKTVSSKDIWLRWFGDYILLWSLPPEYVEAIQPGDQGPAIDWLDKKMALIQGRPANPLQNLLFDDALANEVKQFQFAKNLVPDGIVGPQTIIHLNSAAKAGMPMLINTQKDD